VSCIIFAFLSVGFKWIFAILQPQRRIVIAIVIGVTSSPSLIFQDLNPDPLSFLKHLCFLPAPSCPLSSWGVERCDRRGGEISGSYQLTPKSRQSPGSSG
jgi:hypothetical protein